MATDSLYQRLKELHHTTFERLCLHLIKERHPTIAIKHVNGSGGDEGIDLFYGDLANGPIIWQCKTFPNGIRQGQKQQIRNSLARAIGTVKPQQWVLCTNIDLDTKAHRWFQELARHYHGTPAIGLLQAGDIVHELLHRSTLKHEFFPETSLDGRELRALMTRTGELTTEQLRTLTEENVYQYLQRLKDRDARFNYEITTAQDRAPNTINPPEAIFTIQKDNTMIRAYPRDHDALQLTPPTINFTIRRQAAAKIQEFLDTGIAQYLDQGEIMAFNTDLPLNEELASTARDSTLQLSQTPKGEPYALRLTCGDGAQGVSYEYVPFRLARIGNKEAELTSIANLPFTASIIIREHHHGAISFTEHLNGAEVRDIRKYMKAMSAIQDTKYFEAYDLTKEKIFFRAIMSNICTPKHWERGVKFIDDLAAIADAFSTDLHLPSTPAESDHEAFLVLKAIVEGARMPLEEYVLEITKSEETAAPFLATLDRGTADLRYDLPAFAVTFFQTRINVGPVTVYVLPAPIKDAPARREEWQNAQNGDAVSITLSPAEVTITRTHPATTDQGVC